MLESTYHDHRRALEYADGNQESSGISYGIRTRHEQHDISADTQQRASNDEVATVLHLIGVISRHKDSNESCYVWRHREQLSGGGLVTHAGDDGWKE